MDIDTLIAHLQDLKQKVGGNATVVMLGDAEGNSAHTVHEVQYGDDKGFLIPNHRNIIDEV